MTKSSIPQRICKLATASLLGGSVTACVEDIDALSVDCGMTYCPSSSSESDGSGGTLTGSGTAGSSSDTSGDTTVSMETSTSGGETTSGSSGDEFGSSTGPTPPVCGNGVVEGDESCDDGNNTPGDGCQECARDSVVFITSETYQGFALGGLYGADQRCQSLAAKAGLSNPLTFKAWLSTPGMSASERLLHSRGRYVLANGLVVAQSWEALTSGTIENPIMVDEHSETQDTLAWTGTLATGEPALGSEFCEDWDDNSGLLKYGGVGVSASSDSTWSFFDQGPCGSELRLYCVEQATESFP